MKILNKQKIQEVIDSDDNLIGDIQAPTHGKDLETRASHTTDYNAKVNSQNFKNDFLGRFGFYFYESENLDNIPPVLMDLGKLMYDKYIETLEYYHQHPEKLEDDMELHSETDFTTQPESAREHDFDWAIKVLKVMNDHYKEDGNNGHVNEEKVIEEKLKDSKDDDNELKDSKEVKELKSKKIEDVAELLNKLPKNEKDKLIKLLEA